MKGTEVMLSQAFLPAKTLFISEAEHCALVSVLGALERNELKHVSSMTDQTKGFSMADYLQDYTCVTVGCIAGWAYLMSGRAVFADLVGRGVNSRCEGAWAMSDELYDLFHTNSLSFCEMQRITTEEAASALRNFLTTGKAQWSKVLGHD